MNLQVCLHSHSITCLALPSSSFCLFTAWFSCAISAPALAAFPVPKSRPPLKSQQLRQRKQSQDFSICTDELESYLITFLLAPVEAAIGPALRMFASIFGVRAPVFTEELSHVEIAGATLIGGEGGRVCILGVLAAPPSAAKVMAVSKSELRHHNFPPEVIK